MVKPLIKTSMKILKPILQDIQQQVILPMIRKCLQRWSMYESSTFITTFQHKVYDFIEFYLKEKNYYDSSSSCYNHHYQEEEEEDENDGDPEEEEEEDGSPKKKKKKKNKSIHMTKKKDKMKNQNHSNIPLSLMKRIQPILHTSYMTLRQEEQGEEQQQEQQEQQENHIDTPHEYLIEKTLIEIQKQIDEWWYEGRGE